MNETQFQLLFDKTVEELKALGHIKGGEYAREADRLHNFTNNAEQLGLTAYDVWAIYAGKHWDAIRTWIIDEREGKHRTRSEPIEGRVKDLILYGFLLLALLQHKGTSAPSAEDKDTLLKLIWEDQP